MCQVRVSHDSSSCLKSEVLNRTLETLNEEVDKELDALPEDMQARFMHIGRLLEWNGPMNVREPHVKPIFKKLFEMRLRGRDGISRAIYITITGKRIVVLRIFIKRRKKLPREKSNWHCKEQRSLNSE